MKTVSSHAAETMTEQILSIPFSSVTLFMSPTTTRHSKNIHAKADI